MIKFFAFLICAGLLLPTTCVAESSQKVKACAFDFGGVVAKADREKVVAFLTTTFQASQEELKPAFREWKMVLVSGKSDKEFWEKFAASKGIVLPSNWYDEFEKANAFTDIPETIVIIKELQAQGYLTPLLSNIKDYQAQVVRKCNYYTLFHPVLLSYEIGVEKPDPKAYQILLDRIQLPPSAVVFVDDQKENVDVAIKLGIDAILFTTPEKLREDLKKRGINLK